MILGSVCVCVYLSLIYIYVAAYRFCALRCLFIICFYLLYSNYSTHVFWYYFCLFCFVCFCIVLCIVSSLVFSCVFPVFLQVYRPLPPGENPIAVNKYVILYHIKINLCCVWRNKCVYIIINTTGCLPFSSNIWTSHH